MSEQTPPRKRVPPSTGGNRKRSTNSPSSPQDNWWNQQQPPEVSSAQPFSWALLGVIAGFVLLALFAVFIGLLVAFRPSVEGPQQSASVPNPKDDKGNAAAPQPANDGRPPTQTVNFGEVITSGDLHIKFIEVQSVQGAGQYYGQFRALNLMFIRIQVTNTSNGKIVDWAGWQGKGEVEDEHGNKFNSLSLRGWSCLPNNNTFGGGWDGDYSARIHPQTTYENAIYVEYAPPTSKEVILRFPLGEGDVRLRGPIGAKAQLDRQAALRAKEGVVLEATALIAAVRAGEKGISEAFPIGCKMRAEGVITRKVDQTKSRPDLNDRPYFFWISYEPEKNLNSATSAICYTKDKECFDRIQVGDTVRLIGVLQSVPGRGTPTSPLQVKLQHCVEEQR